MSYIKLKVRSGGIYIKQKKDFQPIDLHLIPHPEYKNQKVLSLVRDSSLKGLFSYLIGETKKVTEIENSSESLVQKLNVTLNKMVKASAYKKVSDPHVTIFFERKDTHKNKSKFKTAPSVNLYQHTFKTADPTIQILEKPLKNILQSRCTSLGDIHNIFKKHVIKSDEQKKYAQLKDDIEKIIHKLEKIPRSQLKIGINTALDRVRDEKPISTKVINLIKEICSLCPENKDFFEKIKNSNYGKFSIFTDLKNTKHWVNTSYHSIVRGEPSFIACVDFDIYLSEEVFKENQNSTHFNWEEVMNKIKKGSSIARWGEGGVVFIDYSGLDEMGCPYNKKDKIFIEIDFLRKAGLKIKKYDWEEEKDKTSKEESRKH